MKRKISSFCLVIFVLATMSTMISASNFSPITKKGKMSEITLAYVKRQNYIIREEKKEIYPDGIVCYFVIYPTGNKFKMPTLVELRDFRINGISYLEMTRRDKINDIEPNTVLYDERSFPEDEYYKNISIKKENGYYVEKVTICGGSIPNNGIINIDLKFGFDREVEEFNYQ